MSKYTLPTLLFMALGLSVTPALAQETDPQAGWWNDRVFYEIFVRSFYDSDGDGIGDLQGVISQLDYLNDGDPNTTDDLGITGIWLMPIMQSPSYHGYDVTDYFIVEEDYGTNQDLIDLIDAAHERGIAVIIDLVINHTSSQHEWFIASAQGDPDYADWYVWADENPNFSGPDSQRVWHPRHGRYYYGLFWDGMPDLNYENETVTAEMQAISQYWLEEMGVDGFRLDAIKHIVEEGSNQESTPSTLAWLEGYSTFIDSIAPDALTVGEVWQSSYAASQYVNNGSVDMVFEFDLATAWVQSAVSGNGAGANTIQNRVVDLYPEGQYATFLTNHDQNRVMSQLRGNVDAARVAASFLLTAPGVPFIYYGEEIGMMGQKPDERIRTPMQWSDDPITAGFTSARRPWEPLSTGADSGVTVADQWNDPDSLLSYYRTLIQLRNTHSALSNGMYIPVDTDSNKVYAFLRQTEEETLLILINPDDRPVSRYALTLEEASVPGNNLTFLLGEGDFVMPELNDNLGFTDYVPFAELPAYGVWIIRFDA